MKSIKAKRIAAAAASLLMGLAVAGQVTFQSVPLSIREYNCSRCGMQMNRDINASINILDRATPGQRGSHAQGEDARPRQEAVLEELRTDKTHPLLDAVIA